MSVIIQNSSFDLLVSQMHNLQQAEKQRRYRSDLHKHHEHVISTDLQHPVADEGDRQMFLQPGCCVLQTKSTCSYKIRIITNCTLS